MPAGRYDFCDYIEDDVVTDIPIRLKVALTIGEGRIHLDFTGSDVQVGSALNVPTAGKVHPFMAVALVNYFVTRDRTIPLNAGVLKPVRMTLPEGSVVNPRFPAACGVRYATVLRIYDAVLGALARAVPEHIPAASGGQGCMVALSLPDAEAGRRHVTVIEPMIGGGGGRPARDGIDGCDASLGVLKTKPAETPGGGGDGADDRRRRRPARPRRHRRLRRLARISQDDAGGDAGGGGPDRRAPLSPGAGLGRARTVSRWLRRAAGLPGLPPRGSRDRARDGAPPLRAMGRGRWHGRRDRQRHVEPGHAGRARATEDRRPRPRARRRAERPHSRWRRSRCPARSIAGRGARRRDGRARLAHARPRGVRRRPRRRSRRR